MRDKLQRTMANYNVEAHGTFYSISPAWPEGLPQDNPAMMPTNGILHCLAAADASGVAQEIQDLPLHASSLKRTST